MQYQLNITTTAAGRIDAIRCLTISTTQHDATTRFQRACEVLRSIGKTGVTLTMACESNNFFKVFKLTNQPKAV